MPSHGRSLSVESLEDRRLLTVNFRFNADAGTAEELIRGFEEAGELWGQLIGDAVTVVVDIAAQNIGGGILGRTTNNSLPFTYTQVRGALLADTTSVEDVIAASNLPAGPALDVFINLTSDNPNGSGSATPYVDNDGGTNNIQMEVPRANARALGLIPPDDPGADGRIVFDTFNNAFDFDRSDGITPGLTDFVFVAAHEIGHLLGFDSGVDALDINDGQAGRPGPFGDDAFDNITVLDMFRSSSGSMANGADLDFAADIRAKNFAIDGGVISIGTFASGRNNGDGDQASHWENVVPPAPTNVEPLGIMDPNAASGEFGNVTALDLIAFDVIGWDLAFDDRFESNDTIGNATPLGSETEITLRDLTIGIEDDDFFQYTANRTGKLVVNSLFDHDAGDIDLKIVDMAGNVLGSSISITDNETVVIPVVSQETYFIHVMGFPNFAVNEYALEIENFPAPIPTGGFFDPGSDTGRSNADNITKNNQPQMFIQADLLNFVDDNRDDTVNFAVDEDEIFEPGEEIPALTAAQATAGDTAGAAVQVWLTNTTTRTTVKGYADPLDTENPVLYSFTPEAPLADGVYIAMAATWIFDNQQDAEGDPASARGRTQLSAPLFQFTVDTVAPPVTIMAIDPATSDTGVPGHGGTFIDLITSDTATGFLGRAEADAIVRLYVNASANTIIDSPADFSLTVALPFDGNEQFPNGQWNTAFIRDLNGAPFPRDGLRTVLVESEDVAGNVNRVNDQVGDASQRLQVFIDTQGPRIDAITISDDPDTAFDESTYDLFNPKSSLGGNRPTPPVDSLDIDVRDLPNRITSFLYNALLNGDPTENPGNYLLRGDASGVIPIDAVAFNPVAPVAGEPATGTITLTFFEPLPDDRFTLTISDSAVDPAGNGLDGETNAIEPQATPQFPSGDGVPGGDFVARFTVDSRPEVGTYCCGSVYVDINDNRVFDPEGQANDRANRDLVFDFGLTTDALFAGDFSPAGAIASSGFDKLAAYGYADGAYRFLLDFNHDGVADANIVSPFQGNAFPVAGNFDNDLNNGDEIAIFDGQRWYLDTTHDNLLDLEIDSDMRGIPLVGDFNGDDQDDLATFDAGLNRFFFDLDRDGIADDTLDFGFPGFSARPVTGDINLDGIDDIGLWVPDRNGQNPDELAEWYFLVSDREGTLPSAIFDPFSPEPLGNDLFVQFGDVDALPIFGNFDPPTNNSNPRLGELTGDMNIDGKVDFDDIEALMYGLTNPDDYELVFGIVARSNGDTTGDGDLDFDDIPGFVALLTSGLTVSSFNDATTALAIGPRVSQGPEGNYGSLPFVFGDTDGDHDVDFDDISGFVESLTPGLSASTPSTDAGSIDFFVVEKDRVGVKLSTETRGRGSSGNNLVASSLLLDPLLKTRTDTSRLQSASATSPRDRELHDGELATIWSGNLDWLHDADWNRLG